MRICISASTWTRCDLVRDYADLCLSEYGNKVRMMVLDYADLCFIEYGDKVRMMVWDYADLCLSDYGDKVRFGAGLC